MSTDNKFQEYLKEHLETETCECELLLAQYVKMTRTWTCKKHYYYGWQINQYLRIF